MESAAVLMYSIPIKSDQEHHGGRFSYGLMSSEVWPSSIPPEDGPEESLSPNRSVQPYSQHTSLNRR